MVTSGRVPTIPRRDHRDGGVLHPAFVLAESLTRGTSWRLAGRLLRVLENMHSPKVGLGEASLRDSDKHACGAVGATVHGLEWPHVSPIHRQGQDTGQFQLVIEKSDTRIWRTPEKAKPRSRRKTAGASGVPSTAA